jgi:hypothetical protein
MATRRMFSLRICDSDAFFELSIEAQALYFHLGLRADDDGFIGSARKILRITGIPEKALNELIDRQYVITFENVAIVITDWRENNYIQADRYKKTIYQNEFTRLRFQDNKYALLQSPSNLDTEWIQDVSEPDTQVRLGKVRLGKDRLEVGEGQGEPAASAAGSEPVKPADVSPTLDNIEPKIEFETCPPDVYQQISSMHGDDIARNAEIKVIELVKKTNRTGLIHGLWKSAMDSYACEMLQNRGGSS